MVSQTQRNTFDRLLERVIEQLPPHLNTLLEEVPVIVEDEPTQRLLEDMGHESDDLMLCGLHWGVPLTHRGVEHAAEAPDQIMLFRGPILRLAAVSSTGRGRREKAELEGQIRITLLHEMGHHFGLDEDELAELGYA